MAQTNISWPGERVPTRLEVEDAQQPPEPAFIRDFKQALMARDIARDYPPISSSGSQPQISESIGRQFNDQLPPIPLTYPQTLLSNFPDIPSSKDLAALESSFGAISKNFVFLRAIFMPDPARELRVPSLRLAMASLASCLSPSIPVHVGAALWSAGFRVWALMLEVDNREARKIESVMAITLIVTYGTMSADVETWLQTSEHIGFFEPIVRRLHMHDYCVQSDKLSLQSKSIASVRNRRLKPMAQDSAFTGPSLTILNSLLMSHVFLVDVVHALHHNRSVLFTSSELFITMPASNHDFHDIYTSLLLEEHPLPSDMNEQEDAVLLLSALLSDIITIHNVFSGFDLKTSETPPLYPSTGSNPYPITNPFVPFSPHSENKRMLSQISQSLDLWEERFREIMPEDIMCFFYFCNLCLQFPRVLHLPQLAGYLPTRNSFVQIDVLDLINLSVPEPALKYAWSVIDHVNVKQLPDAAACPIWLPVVTYITALVVWADLKSNSISKSTHGTLKVLGVFKAELQQMPWPCCTEMVKNLDSLMQA